MGFAGKSLLKRRFGIPRVLDAGERVWLTCAGHSGQAAWVLQGSRIAMTQSGNGLECNVAGLLGERNELLIELEAANDQDGIWGEVALEIRRTAYLRAFQARVQGQTIRITGELFSEFQESLEIYVLAERSNLEYVPVSAQAGSQAVELLLRPDKMPQALRIELVKAAEVWFELTLPLREVEERLE